MMPPDVLQPFVKALLDNCSTPGTNTAGSCASADVLHHLLRG